MTFEEFLEQLTLDDKFNYIEMGASGRPSVDEGFQKANAIAKVIEERGLKDTCTYFDDRRLCDYFVYTDDGRYHGFITENMFTNLLVSGSGQHTHISTYIGGDTAITYDREGRAENGFRGSIVAEGACLCAGSSSGSYIEADYRKTLHRAFEMGVNTRQLLEAIGYKRWEGNTKRSGYLLVCHETKQYRFVNSSSRDYILSWLYATREAHPDALTKIKEEFNLYFPELRSISKPEFTNATADTHNAQALRTLMDLAGVKLGKRAFYRKGDIQSIFPELPWENGRIVLDVDERAKDACISDIDGSKLNVVLTDNPTDMMFASTGQEYSSCFDLTSEYPYNTGLAAMATSAPVFMIALSTGSYVKKEWYNLGSGKRIKLRPLKMKARAFVYLVQLEDGSVVPSIGKIYGVSSRHDTALRELLHTAVLDLFQKSPQYRDVSLIHDANRAEFYGHLFLNKVEVMYGKEKIHAFPYLDNLAGGSAPEMSAEAFWDSKQTAPKGKQCFYFQAGSGGDESRYALSKRGTDNVQARIKRRLSMDKSIKLDQYPLIEDTPEKKSVSLETNSEGLVEAVARPTPPWVIPIGPAVPFEVAEAS